MPDDGLGTSVEDSAFPSENLPEFLYIHSYDNASRSKLLKTRGISHILNVSICSLQNRISSCTALSMQYGQNGVDFVATDSNGSSGRLIVDTKLKEECVGADVISYRLIFALCKTKLVRV
ncbi:hypothetical protein AgCh_003498 [Apium graveolens]